MYFLQSLFFRHIWRLLAPHRIALESPMAGVWYNGSVAYIIDDSCTLYNARRFVIESETMKISKFVWSVLVAFATVALIAPQQVEAVIIDGRAKGQIKLTGSGTITESTGINRSGINSNGINELDFNGQIFPHGPLSVTHATGDFIPIVGSQAIFNLAIRWTGSGSSVTLLDVLPGVGGPAWSSPIVGANGFATGTFFSLKSVTFDEDSLTLIGMGTTQITSGDLLVQKHSAARIVIQGTGQDFTYNLTVVTAVPEVGSTLGLFAIGLVGLVAVEGLRRKIATRQNRYA